MQGLPPPAYLPSPIRGTLTATGTVPPHPKVSPPKCRPMSSCSFCSLH
ncbi:conserved hypothetical protein [Afipia carboxidovorans OM5]|nr:conserved hypothetical protein [Afipia carboxidovorans OM5]